MSLAEIKRRWVNLDAVSCSACSFFTKDRASILLSDAMKLIKVAEAAKVYVHITEREKWEALENLKKALAELEGE